jgi:hypothetical protein
MTVMPRAGAATVAGAAIAWLAGGSEIGTTFNAMHEAQA